MFDLPVLTKKDKREYVRFRKSLLEDGFTLMQYSVYLRHCASKENAEVHINRVERLLPPKGEVRILALTDKQFERMKVFLGKNKAEIEAAPPQLQLF